MDRLPPNKSLGTRDVFKMLTLDGLERVTRSLRMGDAHYLQDLRPLAQRCRALADAYDHRMKQFEENQAE